MGISGYGVKGISSSAVVLTDPTALLQDIDAQLQALVGAYVEPTLFLKYKMQGLGNGVCSQVFDSQQNTVCRLIINVMRGEADVFFTGNAPGSGELPDLRLPAGAPFILPIPNLQLQVVVRGNDVNGSDFSLIFSSAAG